MFIYRQKVAKIDWYLIKFVHNWHKSKLLLENPGLLTTAIDSGFPVAHFTNVDKLKFSHGRMVTSISPRRMNIYPRTNHIGGLTKPLLMLWHGLVTTSQCFTWIYSMTFIRCWFISSLLVKAVPGVPSESEGIKLIWASCWWLGQDPRECW